MNVIETVKTNKYTLGYAALYAASVAAIEIFASQSTLGRMFETYAALPMLVTVVKDIKVDAARGIKNYGNP